MGLATTNLLGGWQEPKMVRKTILVVEDEEDILELVEYNLAKNGFDTVCLLDGETGLETIRTRLPDLVVLDLMLPGLDGLGVCRILKSDPKTRDIPIIMLTAKGEESDIVTGLELGADDYITKPFSPKVLIARIRAVLRRKSQETVDEKSTVRIHDITIEPGRHEVLVRGEPVQLTLTEFRILHLLARRPGWVFTRYQIVDEIRGEDYPVTDRSVDVHIVGLRKKLGTSGKHIDTVRGVGYRMKE
jgi:two-component system phosphate regulon response regulator PhoB